MSENAFVSELGGSLTPNHSVEPAELVGDQIDSALQQFDERARALIAAAEKRTITDNDEIGKAADLRSMIDALMSTLWNRAKEIAEPHTRATNVVRGRTQRFVTPLETASETLRVRIGECRTMQRDRARKQAEEQRAAEAALRKAAGVQAPQDDASAAAAPAALPSVKGDYGSSVSDRATTSYAYEDVRALPNEVLNAPAVKKAIQSAIRAYARLNPNVPGVTSSAGVETSHRRPN